MLILIEKLGCLGTKKSWGIYKCSFCLKIIKIRTDVAKKQYSCGCKTNEIISEKALNTWKKEEYRNNQKEIHDKIWNSKEFKISQSKKSKLVWDSFSNEEKERRKIILKKIWDIEGYRENQSIRKKEYFEKNPNKKIDLSDKIKKLWEIAEYREEMIKKQKLGRNVFLASEESYSYREASSNRMKKLWEDKNFKNLTVSKIMKSNGAKKGMNNSEKCLFNILLNVFFEGQFTFVGDGEVIIGGKCPDFIDKTNNKIIELYGDYWHKGQDPNDKINYYKTFGYDTLVIWESELKNITNLKNKLLEFTL